ncbi:DinB family protein [Chloroflexota bacterium]
MSISRTKEETLALFLSGAERLETILASLSAASLDLAAKPGEWTIRQMVHHLADDGDALSMPLKKAIAISGALIRFEGFPGNDVWANAMAFDKRDIANSVALIKAHRQVMAELARYFIDDWDSR